MKEFIEKLIGRLEEELKTAREMQTTQCIGHDGYGTPLQSKLGGEICALLKVQNIVNQLAEEYKPKTQADKIRAMNDEELAEFIDKVSRTCLVDALGGKSECNTECRMCKIKFGSILDWLQSEAETKGE